MYVPRLRLSSSRESEVKMKIEKLRRFDVDVSTAQNTCPHCGYKTDRASGDVQPQAGDISVCLRCGNPSLFTEGLGLRLPTLTEQLDLDGNSEIEKIQSAIRQVWAEAS